MKLINKFLLIIAVMTFAACSDLEPEFTDVIPESEYFANEDFDKALAYYRNAITRDPRHYNAWCVQATTHIPQSPCFACFFCPMAYWLRQCEADKDRSSCMCQRFCQCCFQLRISIQRLTIPS